MKRPIVFILIISLILLSTVGCKRSSGEVNSGSVTSGAQSSVASSNIVSSQSGSSVISGQTSASNDTNQSSAPNDGQGQVTPIEELCLLIEPTADAYEAPTQINKVTADDLFELHNHIAIQVDIDEEELEKIEDDNRRGPKPEIYRLARKVTIELTTRAGASFSWELENVGIRQKGNTSREEIFIGNEVNPHNHFKLSFDETFDDVSYYGADFVANNAHPENADRTFLGLTGIDFKWNKNDDQTHLREIYASYLYRAAGIIVQRVGLSTVRMNDVEFGLCNIFEPSSKSLIKLALQSGDEFIGMSDWKTEKKGVYGINGANYGDLYKASYGIGSGSSSRGADMSPQSVSGNRVGVKTDIYGNDIPAYERKTNKSVAYNDDRFKSAVTAINDGSYGDIAQVVDLTYLAVEEAVAFFVGNPDSMRYNYNNYQLYIRRTDGRMIFIPIDNDRAFGTGNTWEDGLRFVYSSERTIYDKKDVNGGDNRNPLLNKTILSDTDNECKKLYTDYINLLIGSAWLKEETFLSYFEIIKETYDGEAKFNQSNGANVAFASFIQKKISSVLSPGEGDDEYEDEEFIYWEQLYVVGTFNNWGDYDFEDLYLYKLEESADGKYYEVTFVVEENGGDVVKIKLNDGFNYYDVNDFTFRGELDDLALVPRESSFRIEGATIGSIITVRVDVETQKASIIIE